jgi:hypothetical protein
MMLWPAVKRRRWERRLLPEKVPSVRPVDTAASKAASEQLVLS